MGKAARGGGGSHWLPGWLEGGEEGGVYLTDPRQQHCGGRSKASPLHRPLFLGCQVAGLTGLAAPGQGAELRGG